MSEVHGYLAHTKTPSPLGPYSKPWPRTLCKSEGGGHFLMREVLMYRCTCSVARDGVDAEGVDAYRGTSLIRNTPPVGPSIALCIGTYGDPRGVGVSHARDAPTLSLLSGIPQACEALGQLGKDEPASG